MNEKMTIFSQLQNALAPYVGGADASGLILGTTTIVILFTGFLIMFGKDFFRGSTGFIFLLIGVSIVSAPGIGWFPLWVPFLIVLSLAFLYWQKYL